MAKITDMEAAVRVADRVPAMAKVSKIYGREKAEVLIKAFLFDLEDYFDFDKKMNAAQLDFISARIMDKYYGITLADMHVIFSGIKSGTVGEFYGRIRPDVILKEIDRYWGARCAAFADKSYSEHISDKGDNITSRHAAEQFARLEKKFRK